MAKWDQFDLDTEIDDSAPFVDADIEFRRRPIKIPLFFAFAASVLALSSHLRARLISLLITRSRGACDALFGCAWWRRGNRREWLSNGHA